MRRLAIVGFAMLFAAQCHSATGPAGDTATYQALVAGGFHTCALSTQHVWYCWGHSEGSRSELKGPLAEAADWTRPRRLLGDPGLVELSAGETFTCGLTLAGVAYCWGGNEAGSLGLGFVGGEFATPQLVESHLRFSHLAGASTPAHMCGLSDQRAYCWGNNFRHQLGAGLVDHVHPYVEPVETAESFTVIAAGGSATCALNQRKDVYCWGALAPGTDDLETPVLVAAETGFDTLVAGNGVRCGLRSGRAFCHGTNTTGALGTGDLREYEGFVEVAGGHEFVRLSGGRTHICGVALNGQAFCWGYGMFGRLGNGSDENALAPVKVVGDHRFEVVVAGGEHTCGLTVDGDVYCWGSGLWGQIGNGETGNYSVPVRISEPQQP